MGRRAEYPRRTGYRYTARSNVSTDTSELRPPQPNDEGQAEGSRSLLADVRAAVASDEVALRVLVTACVTLAVGWIGI
jgi:hypothetical protein